MSRAMAMAMGSSMRENGVVDGIIMYGGWVLGGENFSKGVGLKLLGHVLVLISHNNKQGINHLFSEILRFTVSGRFCKSFLPHHLGCFQRVTFLIMFYLFCVGVERKEEVVARRHISLPGFFLLFSGLLLTKSTLIWLFGKHAIGHGG